MMEDFPTDLVVLMDELSPIEFLKLAFYKMNKMTIESSDELTELDKVMCKAADISTNMKLKMISPALRDRFFKLVAEKGLDKPPSLLSGCSSEQAIQMQTAPSQKSSMPPTYFQNDKQPTLFQNTSRPSDMDPASFQMAHNQPDTHPVLFQSVLNQPDSHPASLQGGTPNPQDSEPFNKRISAFQDVLESYETEPFEAEVLVQSKSSQLKETAQRATRRQYREQSRSPPAAYKGRSSSRPRSDVHSKNGSSRRSRSPPAAYKSRSSSRPRHTTESSRRSRSPPSSYRSFSRFDAQNKQEPARDEAKESKRDEGNSSRKGLSFSFAPRRKYPGGDKPPVKF